MYHRYCIYSVLYDVSMIVLFSNFYFAADRKEKKEKIENNEMKDKMNDMEVKNETIVEKDQIKQEKLNIDKKISHENQQKTTENIFANKEKKETLDDLIIRKSMKKRKKPTTTVNLSKTVKKKKSFLNF